MGAAVLPDVSVGGVGDALMTRQVPASDLAGRMSYYAVAARRAGVPDMWLEDAAQDIALRTWRASNDSVMVVHAAAVDAARKYGRYGRSGYDRAAVDLSAVVVAIDPWSSVDWCVDAKRALAKLLPHQRRSLAGWADPHPHNSEQVMRGQARRALKHLMVAA